MNGWGMGLRVSRVDGLEVGLGTRMWWIDISVQRLVFSCLIQIVNYHMILYLYAFTYSHARFICWLLFCLSLSAE